MAVATSHTQRESRVLIDVGDEHAVMRHKSAAGTYKTDVGNSQFYSKPGILTIFDSNESLDSSRRMSATLRMRNLTSHIFDGSRFPKLEECAHFHYDVVELSEVKVHLHTEDIENIHYQYYISDTDQHTFYINVFCNGKTWVVKRTYENFRMLDKQLHKCIFDRKFSQLPEIPKGTTWIDEGSESLQAKMNDYLLRFSQIANSMVNCGPILNWFEMDNRGNRIMVTNESAINTPAIAAAHVIKRYTARAPDEVCFEVGDIISVIDMPPTEDTVWWRGKKGFEVGFFPSECVELIGDKLPQSMAHKLPVTPLKPVLRRRGKIISFLRMFFFTRPSKTSLKQSGIMKERVFSCDLGEHLLNTGQEVPLVLKCCSEIIEKHGIVDGIYRLSGVASNIQKLRCAFDENRIPELTEEEYLQDIHCISSLLKMYFRELPNPLLTYQLYDKFAAAVQDDDNKLMMMFDVVQQLPPPHYRTSQFLFRHLAKVAAHGHDTGMHPKNLAIVWAPNLLRSKELEAGCGAAALQGVGLQAVVTEFLILYADIIFSDKVPACITMGEKEGIKRIRPKSLACSTPTKLLSLEEARERVQSVVTSSPSPSTNFIEVGGGPAKLPEYHTVIDFPGRKRSSSLKTKKAGSLDRTSGSNWKSFFTKSRSSSAKKRKHSAPSTPKTPMLSITTGLPLTAPDTVSFFDSSDQKSITEEDIVIGRQHKIRSTKSEETINSASDSDIYRSSDFGGYNFSAYQYGGFPNFSTDLGEGVCKSLCFPEPRFEFSASNDSHINTSASSNSDEDESKLRSSEIGEMMIAAEAASIAKKTQHLTDMEEELCLEFDRTSQSSRLSQSLPPITSGPRRNSVDLPESKSDMRLTMEFEQTMADIASIGRVSSISEIMARAFPINQGKKKSKSPSMSPPMLKYSKSGTSPVGRSKSLHKSTGSSNSSLASPLDNLDSNSSKGKISFYNSTGSLSSPEHYCRTGAKVQRTPSDEVFPMEMTESMENFQSKHLSSASDSGLISPIDGGFLHTPSKKGLRRTRSARMSRKDDDHHHHHHLVHHRTPSAELSCRSSEDMQSLGDAYIGPETENEAFTLSEPTIQNYMSLPPDVERTLEAFDSSFVSHNAFLSDEDEMKSASRKSSKDDPDSMGSDICDGLKTPDIDIGDFVSEMQSIVEHSRIETEFGASGEVTTRTTDSETSGDGRRFSLIEVEDDVEAIETGSDVQVACEKTKVTERKPVSLLRGSSMESDTDRKRLSYEDMDKVSSESSPIHVAASIALPKTPDSDEWKPWSYDDGGTLSPDFSKYDVQYNELKSEVDKYLATEIPEIQQKQQQQLVVPIDESLHPIRKSQSYERAISGGDLEAVYTPLTDESKRMSTELRELHMIGEADEKSLKTPESDKEIIIDYPPLSEMKSDDFLAENEITEAHSDENKESDVGVCVEECIDTSPVRPLQLDLEVVNDDKGHPLSVTLNDLEQDALHYSPEVQSSPVAEETNPASHCRSLVVDIKSEDQIVDPSDGNIDAEPVSLSVLPKSDSDELHITSVLGSLRNSQQDHHTTSRDVHSNSDSTCEPEVLRLTSSPIGETDSEDCIDQIIKLAESSEKYADFTDEIEESQRAETDGKPEASLADSWECLDTTNYMLIQRDKEDNHSRNSTHDETQHQQSSDVIDIDQLPKPEDLGLTIKVAEEDNAVIIERPSPPQSPDDESGLVSNFTIENVSDTIMIPGKNTESSAVERCMSISPDGLLEKCSLDDDNTEELKNLSVSTDDRLSGPASSSSAKHIQVDDKDDEEVERGSNCAHEDVFPPAADRMSASVEGRVSFYSDDGTNAVGGDSQNEAMSSSLEGRISLFEKFKKSPRPLRAHSDDHDINNKGVSEPAPAFSRQKSDVTSVRTKPSRHSCPPSRSIIGANSSLPQMSQTYTTSHNCKRSDVTDVKSRPASSVELSPNSSRSAHRVGPPVSEKPKRFPSPRKSESSPTRHPVKNDSLPRVSRVTDGQSAVDSGVDISQENTTSSDNQSDDGLDHKKADAQRKKSIRSLLCRFEETKSEDITEGSGIDKPQVKKHDANRFGPSEHIAKEGVKTKPAVFQKPQFERLRSLSPDCVPSGKRVSDNSDSSESLDNAKLDSVDTVTQQLSSSLPAVPDVSKRPSLSRSRFSSSSVGASDGLNNIRGRYVSYGAVRSDQFDNNAENSSSGNIMTSSVPSTSSSEDLVFSSNSQSSVLRNDRNVLDSDSVPRLSRSTSMNEDNSGGNGGRLPRKEPDRAPGRGRTVSHYDQEDDVYEKLQESFRKRTSRSKFDDSDVVVVKSADLIGRLSDAKSPTSADVPAGFSNVGSVEPEWAKLDDAECDEPKVDAPVAPVSRPRLKFITTPRSVEDKTNDEPYVQPQPKPILKKDESVDEAASAFGIKLRKTRKE